MGHSNCEAQASWGHRANPWDSMYITITSCIILAVDCWTVAVHHLGDIAIFLAFGEISLHLRFK